MALLMAEGGPTVRYRIAENGEWIRIQGGREDRTDFYFVRGGRLA